MPEGLYNFIVPSKGKNSDLWFYSTLGSLTFANDPGKNLAGSITVTLKEADDLKRWRCCHERVAVIRTATGALLWPLLEEIEESDQLLRGGGDAAPALPTVPISLTRAYLHHAQAVDVPLPDNPPPITDQQLDLLRTATSLVLRRKIAETALEEWAQRRVRPTAYRENGFTLWHRVLLETCLKVWFSDAEYQLDREQLLSDSRRRQEEQERAIAETLQRGLDLLSDPAKYIDKIIERPASRAEWDEAVQEGKLAFWFTPVAGSDKGTTFLAFVPDTLKSLIARARCTPDLYEAFKMRCADTGLLASKNRPIKLGKDEIAAITFSIQRP